MIIHVINNTENTWIVSVQVRSFIHLNGPCFEQVIWTTLLMSIVLNQAFCWVNDIWQLVYMIQQFLFTCYKRFINANYKKIKKKKINKPLWTTLLLFTPTQFYSPS